MAFQLISLSLFGKISHNPTRQTITDIIICYELSNCSYIDSIKWFGMESRANYFQSLFNVSCSMYQISSNLSLIHKILERMTSCMNSICICGANTKDRCKVFYFCIVELLFFDFYAQLILIVFYDFGIALDAWSLEFFSSSILTYF